MAQESQNAEDKLWPSHIEKMFIDLMVDEQQKGNMEHGIFKGLAWLSMTNSLSNCNRSIIGLEPDPKANALRKSGCPSYDKLRQLFAANAAIGAFQISSNTPAPDSNEECALEEEIANERSRTQLGADDCYNPDMEGIT
nr:hypothetical protein CFP56_22633 [Quercus suber]